MKKISKRRSLRDRPVSPPVVLTRKQIFILPTRYGYLFIILLIAMLIGSINYNNNLGFLLTFLLGSMGIVSLLYTFKNISGIGIISSWATPVFAGETAVFELLVRVDRISRSAVRFRFSGQEDSVQTDLTDQEGNRVRSSMPAPERGLLKPGVLFISTIYPLGLFRAWSRIMLDLKCLVYPKPLPGSLQTEKGFSRNGDAGGASGPGVDDFQGLTSYQPGDPMQHISWKTYSKGQGLFTKKFEGDSAATAVFDWFSIRVKDTEKKLSVMSGMILKAHEMNMEYGLIVPGTAIDPDWGNAHKHKCLKSLAMFQNDEERRSKTY